ncbi:nicotinamide riboside transporter PnuC [Thiotrichales bacterium 19S3-7]|nr:nicotinamide riboside transporter PnuC [Thiotrichales bacterium 19S3-7]MCF6802941.1 nicotinamide riboside transporter PnuC [Thiotrichales bacterium 19S3-11]
MLEACAVIAAFLGVYLAARENILNWLVGIVEALLYTYIFYKSQLYSDMILNVVYLPIQVIGYISWAKRDQRTHKKVFVIHKLKPLIFAILFLVIIALAYLWSLFDSYFLHGEDPFLDSFVLISALAGQWLLIRKVLQCWYIWICVTSVSCYIFFLEGLYLSSFARIIFLAVAIYGLIFWYRRYREHLTKK